MIEAFLLLCTLIAMVILLLAENRSSNNSDINLGVFGYRDLIGKESKSSKLSKAGKAGKAGKAVDLN